jgi:hypothetical protein
MVTGACSPAIPDQEICGPPQIQHRRASGARAAERINCPSWTVARASFTGYVFLGQLLDKVGFEALVNNDN